VDTQGRRQCIYVKRVFAWSTMFQFWLPDTLKWYTKLQTGHGFSAVAKTQMCSPANLNIQNVNANYLTFYGDTGFPKNVVQDLSHGTSPTIWTSYCNWLPSLLQTCVVVYTDNKSGGGYSCAKPDITELPTAYSTTAVGPRDIFAVKHRRCNC